MTNGSDWVCIMLLATQVEVVHTLTGDIVGSADVIIVVMTDEEMGSQRLNDLPKVTQLA